MVRHKQRTIRWSIAASLLAHSLFIGIALGFAVFGAHMIIRNATLVTLVSSIAGDQGTSGVDRPSTSSTDDPSQTSLNLVDRRTQRPVLDTKPVAAQEATSRPPVVARTTEGKLKTPEEEIAHDTQVQDELIGQEDQAVTVEDMLVASALQASRQADPTDGQAGGQERTETVEFAGARAGSAESGSGPGRSSDILAKFLAQVRQAIERERNKQYSRLDRFKGLEGNTQLRFRITPTGEPTDIQVVQSSQSAVLDEESIAIVKRAAPFPQLPAGLDQGLLIQLQMLFQLERG